MAKSVEDRNCKSVEVFVIIFSKKKFVVIFIKKN